MTPIGPDDYHISYRPVKITTAYLAMQTKRPHGNLLRSIFFSENTEASEIEFNGLLQSLCFVFQKTLRLTLDWHSLTKHHIEKNVRKTKLYTITRLSFRNFAFCVVKTTMMCMLKHRILLENI